MHILFAKKLRLVDDRPLVSSNADVRPVNTAAVAPASVIFGAFLVLLVYGTAATALRKPLWHDEIFTLYLATRTTVPGLWEALSRGTDLNPPLYHLAVKLSAIAFHNDALATRLPALVGFAAATLAMFVFLRRRLGAWFALMGAVVPAASGFYVYAYEGRPYGLVLGFSAVALAAWQRRGDGNSRTAALLCALMLMAATMTHYYAVLMVLPLAVAELTRTLLRKRIDWSMWVAFVSAAAPLTILWPMIRSAREFAPAFWSRPAPAQLSDLYSRVVEPFGLLILVAGVVTTIVWLFERSGTRPLNFRPVGEVPRDLDPADIAAALGLMALPVVGFCLALTVTGAFHERYVIQVVLGFSILAAWCSARFVRSRKTMAILVGVLIAGVSVRMATGFAHLTGESVDPYGTHRRLLALTPEDADVVVSHVLTFLPLTYYASLSGASRQFTYLIKPAEIVERVGVDTGGRALGKLAEVVPMDLQNYDTFVASHHRFYLYGPQSWVTSRLLSQHANVRLLGSEDDVSLYAVEMPR